jgi:hypothetical protein
MATTMPEPTRVVFLRWPCEAADRMSVETSSHQDWQDFETGFSTSVCAVCPHPYRIEAYYAGRVAFFEFQRIEGERFFVSRNGRVKLPVLAGEIHVENGIYVNTIRDTFLGLCNNSDTIVLGREDFLLAAEEQSGLKR